MTIDTGETLTVTVHDTLTEAAYWGRGYASPLTREVTISAYCPQCGGKRGEPRWHRQCDDGEWYSVQVWTNPCGHVDMYDAVLVEAKTRAEVAAHSCDNCDGIDPKSCAFNTAKLGGGDPR